MKNRCVNLLAAGFLFLIVSSCASTSGSTTTGSNNDDKTTKPTTSTESKAEAEDLSKYRPKFKLPPTPATPANAGANPFTPLPGSTPTNHVNERVAVLLDTMAIMNKAVRYAKGYRILAYTGTERKAAMDVRNIIVSRLPDVQVYPQYKQPTWRVKVGDFFNRVEANQALLRIRDITPNAMIVEDQINVK